MLVRALDAWWDAQGRPDAFTVYDAGAGAGTLGRSLALAGSPHRYVAVDRSTAQRARHQGLESAAELPDGPLVGVVLANELLDNLPFDLTVGGRPFDPGQDWPETGLAPRQDQARQWVEGVLARLRGRLVVVDYVSTTAAMATRPWPSGCAPTGPRPGRRTRWTTSATRTSPPRWPSTSSRRPTGTTARPTGSGRGASTSLVEEGRRIWHERAHLGDLEAIRARSRVNEAEALLDPAGLGSFRVLEWSVVDDPGEGDPGGAV